MKLIALYSTVQGSGKSTVARLICKHHRASVLPFAQPVKKATVQFLQVLGIEDAAGYVYIDKESQLPGMPEGVTARFIQQRLGTDFVRKMIDPDAWVKAWERELSDPSLYVDPQEDQIIIADDMRFMNEAISAMKRDGQLWRIVSPSAIRADERRRRYKGFLGKLFHLKKGKHASEGNLDDLEFDVTIVNDGTVEQLEAKVLDALKSIR